MILTCPKCATRFFVAEEAIGPRGRSVECDVCHAVWFSQDDESVQTAETDTPDVSDSISNSRAAREPLSVSPAETPLFVERAAPPRRSSKINATLPWGLIFLLLVVAFVIGVLVFRSQIERMFPATLPVYQSVGLRS